MSDHITSPHNRLSVEELNERRRAARRYRAEWLLALRAGAVDLSDVLRQSKTDEGSPLAALGLRDILNTAPGGTPAKANKTIQRTLDGVGVEMRPSAVKVRWLTDRRASVRRLTSLADAMTRDSRKAPSATWPW